ncbi:MAG: double zinc ribbon domain-containing protein [Nitrososphaerales archaeon]
MCTYCQVDGSCIHEQCSCSLSGPSRCSGCGHDCEPWWSGLQVPGRNDLVDVLTEFAEDRTFPATKKDIVDYVGEDQWIRNNLPEGSYKDPGEVMLAVLPPLKWSGDNTSLVSASQEKATPSGTKLVVAEGQAAVIVGQWDYKPYDVFLTGEYTLTPGNAPKISARSRSPAPGFSRMIFLGAPLFISLTHETSTPLNLMTLAASKQMCGVKGSAMWKVESPVAFVDYVSMSLKTLDASKIISTLNTQFNSFIRKEIASRSLVDLKNNSAALAKTISDDASKIGLYAVVTIEYVGEPTPEMAAAMLGEMQSSRANMMAATAQIRSSNPTPKESLHGAPQMPGDASPNLVCQACGASNPPTGKFCNNCGKALVQQKLTCPKCGKEAAAATKFCGNCGARMTP